MLTSTRQTYSPVIFERDPYPLPPLDICPFPRDGSWHNSRASSRKGQPPVIEDFLARHGIVIIEKTLPEEENINEIAPLLDTINNDYPMLKNLFRVLRNAISERKGKFTFTTKNSSQKVAAAVKKVLETMQNCGLFSELRLQKESGSFSGQVASSSKVQGFIKGTWLELYCQKNGIKVIKNKARALRLPYRVLSNVKVRDSNGKNHEIDMMFSIGDKVFALEQKTGTNFCNYDNYRKVADYLHLAPDHFMIVNSSISDKKAENCIKYFYHYYTCISEEYMSTLAQMIDNAFKK